MRRAGTAVFLWPYHLITLSLHHLPDRATIRALESASSIMEINQLRRSLEDLTERNDALRRFL
jgi:hypothetical protein